MEILIGSPQDQRFLRNYLRSVRSLSPREYVGHRTITSLEQIRDGAWACDWPLFEQLVDDAAAWVEDELDMAFDPIPFSHWFLIDGSGSTGGFYSNDSYGYCDVPGLAFMARPVGERFAGMASRSIELARGYLHDSFHATTFKSYGVKRGVSLASPKAPPTLYRFQHGFNFRTADGTSYSAPQHAISNGGINLGVLMDGVGTILTGDALRACLPPAKADAIDRGLLADIFCATPLSNGTRFFADVVETTQRYLERFHRIPIHDYARAMFSGDVGTLGVRFESAYGTSWQAMFCQPPFLERVGDGGSASGALADQPRLPGEVA